MSDSHDHDHNPSILHPINDAVVANSNSPMVFFALKLSHPGGKGIGCEFCELGRNSSLHLPVERTKFPGGRRR